MGVQSEQKRWKTQTSVRTIKVDYKEPDTGKEDSFTFVLRSDRQLVACRTSGKILAALALRRKNSHVVYRNPRKIMDALAENALPARKADMLVFVFSGRHRKTHQIWARVFAIAVVE